MNYIYLQCVKNNKKLTLSKFGVLTLYINNVLIHEIYKCSEFDFKYYRDNLL